MKKKAIKIVLKITIIIAIVITFALLNDQITENRKRTFVPIIDGNMDGNRYAYQIESINVLDEELIIKGWFFELQKVRNEIREVEKDIETGIVLYRLDSEVEKDIAGKEKPRIGLRMEMKYENREDVNRYFKCEYDYSKSGFTASIQRSLLDLDNVDYQIVIKADSTGLTGILTEAYIHKGVLCYTNPKEKKQLKVEGTDLQSIVDEGVCIVNYPEHDIYVYQVDNKLYWIADEGFILEDDGSTYIQYIIDTTQFDKLGDNISVADLGASFEKNEITQDINCGKYRVCVRDIPQEYSVTRIATGYHNNGKWVWLKYFRPQYYFVN